MGNRTVFDGVTYYRSEGRSYYTSGKRRYQALHQEVWKAAHGPIPDGFDIHHIDRNPDNNALDNLACLTEAEHVAVHLADRVAQDYYCERCGRAYQTFDQRRVSRFCSNKCKAAARRASGVDDVERLCAWCGSKFRSNRYEPTANCSRTCAQRYRAKHG